MSNVWSYELDVNPNIALETIYANTKNDPMQTQIDVFSGKTWGILANPNEKNMGELLKEQHHTEFCGYVSDDAFQVSYLPFDTGKNSLFTPYVLGIAKKTDRGSSLVCEFRYQSQGFKYILYIVLLLMMSFFLRELSQGDYLFCGLFGIIFFPSLLYFSFKNRQAVELHEQKLQGFFQDLFKEHLLGKKDLPHHAKEQLPQMELTAGVDLLRIVLLTLYLVVGLIFAMSITIKITTLLNISKDWDEIIIGPSMIIFIALYIYVTGLFWGKKKKS